MSNPTTVLEAIQWLLKSTQVPSRCTPKLFLWLRLLSLSILPRDKFFPGCFLDFVPYHLPLVKKGFINISISSKFPYVMIGVEGSDSQIGFRLFTFERSGPSCFLIYGSLNQEHLCIIPTEPFYQELIMVFRVMYRLDPCLFKARLPIPPPIAMSAFLAFDLKSKLLDLVSFIDFVADLYRWLSSIPSGPLCPQHTKASSMLGLPINDPDEVLNVLDYLTLVRGDRHMSRKGWVPLTRAQMETDPALTIIQRRRLLRLIIHGSEYAVSKAPLDTQSSSSHLPLAILYDGDASLCMTLLPDYPYITMTYRSRSFSASPGHILLDEVHSKILVLIGVPPNHIIFPVPYDNGTPHGRRFLVIVSTHGGPYFICVLYFSPRFIFYMC